VLDGEGNKLEDKMRVLVVVFSSMVLFSCASKPSIKNEKMNCVKEFLNQHVEALKAMQVCDWTFKRQ